METVDVVVVTVCGAVEGWTDLECADECTSVCYSDEFDTLDADSPACISGE